MSRTKECSEDLVAFGHDLHDWLYADPGGWNVLPLAYPTWLQGGCWLLARALQRWIGPGSEIWSIWSSRADRGMMDHVVVRVGDCYLDGDGASNKEELLVHWEKEELLRKPFLKRFRAEEAGVIECPVGAVRELVSALEATFGPGEQVLEWART
jgi:hypothetical protein